MIHLGGKLGRVICVSAVMKLWKHLKEDRWEKVFRHISCNPTSLFLDKVTFELFVFIMLFNSWFKIKSVIHSNMGWMSELHTASQSSMTSVGNEGFEWYNWRRDPEGKTSSDSILYQLENFGRILIPIPNPTRSSHRSCPPKMCETHFVRAFTTGIFP